MNIQSATHERETDIIPQRGGLTIVSHGNERVFVSITAIDGHRAVTESVHGTRDFQLPAGVYMVTLDGRNARKVVIH